VTDHKMTRHEMKQDDLVTAIERAGKWARENTSLLRNTGLAALAVVVIAVAAYWLLAGRASESGRLLREAQERFEAPVGAPATGGALSYATPAERDRAALELFEQLVARYSGRGEGKIGRYYQGILLARLGRNQEAAAALSAFLESPSSPILGSLARAQLAQVRTQEGRLDEAASLYQELANDTAGAFPKDFALFYLAGVLSQQGKTDEAMAAYRRITTEFPSSPLAAEAGRLSRGA